MSRLIDLTGQRFGRLYVICQDEEHLKHPNRREAYWWCQCSCPLHTKISVSGTDLRSGHTTSCGCYQKENNHRIVTYKSVYKKGISKTYPELLKYWERLIKSKKYVMCDRWTDSKNGVHNFIEDMKDTHFKRARLHRKDPNLPYSKENCFWDSGNYVVDIPPEKKEL
jgi:hypothetical protein